MLNENQLQLPEPGSAEQALSQNLQELIIKEINETGPITLARYMELALYAPSLGYYRNGSQKFGEQGDFVTAPELSPLFSYCVARQCQQILTCLLQGNILEFGAGSGIMARTILQSLAKTESLPQHYYILELSAELRHRQRQEFENQAPELLSHVIWLDQLPQNFRGVILANEVIDAMPVHRFGSYQGLKEYYVTHKNNQLAWQLGALNSQELKEQLAGLATEFQEGYSSEINLFLPGWINSLDALLSEGVILLMDYGYTRNEYYHSDRSDGTLICHYRHRAHSDLFRWPGLQDITSFVDFTAVAEAAVSGSLEVLGYIHQAGFLINCGITDFMSGQEEPMVRLKLSRQIQRLTLPGEMGEAFKVMALSKNMELPLLGFGAMNQIERL